VGRERIWTDIVLRNAGGRRFRKHLVGSPDELGSGSFITTATTNRAVGLTSRRFLYSSALKHLWTK
jgi:hypothetical protein